MTKRLTDVVFRSSEQTVKFIVVVENLPLTVDLDNDCGLVNQVLVLLEEAVLFIKCALQVELLANSLKTLQQIMDIDRLGHIVMKPGRHSLEQIT